jgi:hypothetical protein
MNFTKISEFLKDKDPWAKLSYFSLVIGMGNSGTTVGGTDPCSTGGHPQPSIEKRRLQ